MIIPARAPWSVDTPAWREMFDKRLNRDILLDRVRHGLDNGLASPVVVAIDPRGGAARRLAIAHFGVPEAHLDGLVAKVSHPVDVPLVIEVVERDEILALDPRLVEKVRCYANPMTNFHLVCFWDGKDVVLDYHTVPIADTN